ncbi:MAG: YhfC family glutamic-type intramembrane protease, partial [Vagococcus sp.]
FAIILHVGLSVLVMKTVKSNKKHYVIFAIFIHTAIDSMVGIIPMFVSNGVIMIEVTLAIVSLLLFLYAIFLRKGWELS